MIEYMKHAFFIVFFLCSNKCKIVKTVSNHSSLTFIFYFNSLLYINFLKLFSTFHLNQSNLTCMWLLEPPCYSMFFNSLNPCLTLIK